MKAIETRYAGCRFRSRLEARWAVFFDAMGINWEYEAQGYQVEVESGYDNRIRVIRYLPDFWLPDLGFHVEVKGDPKALTAAADPDGCEDMTWMLDFDSPLPEMSGSMDARRGGLVLLGPIPQGRFVTHHPLIKHHEGLCLTWLTFISPGLAITIPRAEDECISGCEDYSRDVLIESGNPAPTSVQRAYTAARSARFEFGECGV